MKVLKNIFLLSALFIIFSGLFYADEGEELISGPFKNTFTYDFNGDSKKDDFILEWKIVRDSSYNPVTKTTSDEKYIWYQSHFQIVLTDGDICHEDAFSMVERDYNNMIAMTESKNIIPKDYFHGFFNIKYYGKYYLNSIQERKISKEEISLETIKEIIKYYKSNAKAEEIEKELLSGKHIVVLYRRSWREDVGIIVFSNILRKAIWLNSGY